LRSATIVTLFATFVTAACTVQAPPSQGYGQPSGNASLSWLGLRLDQKRAQAEYDRRKASIESDARSGFNTWVVAARLVRELDQRFAQRTDLDAGWKFDSDDEEYHAFSIAAAALVDNRQVTFDEYDAARTKRFNEIQARRAAMNAGRRQSAYCVTQVTGFVPFQRLVTICN
jgi:hypothetical protein